MTLLAGMIQPPLEGRSSKPRSCGVTMIMDKGLSVVEMTSLLAQSAEYIDFIKLAFGTLALYPPEVLHQKIELARQYRIPIYPGGTFLEIAYWENQIDSCLPKLQELGIEWLEISDGTLNIPQTGRAALIKKGVASGFHILTEVGKKNTAQQPNAAEIAHQALFDLENGAQLVIIEARESGTGIGIYDQQGQIQKDAFFFLKDILPNERILWEAPLKSQQSELINTFGPNVNIGNLPPSEALALEALRQGLRSDTWLPQIKKTSR